MPLRRFFLAHLFISAAIAATFAWTFRTGPRAVAGHILLIAEWDVALLAAVSALRLPRQSYRVLIAITCTTQVFLYALNLISNESWDRNMTAHLVSAFAPTVWSGKEPFPIGPIGITAFACGTLLAVAAIFAWLGRGIDDAAGVWMKRVRGLRVGAIAVG